MDPLLIERYLLLGLRLGRHIDGLVDAYYGPRELQERVGAEALTSPGELRDEAGELMHAVASSGAGDRATWLSAQLEGLATTAERLDGRPVGYLDEIRRCYGIAPRTISEDDLAEVHHRLDGMLTGAGSLRERFQAWQHSQELRRDQVLPALTAINLEIQSRTRILYGLPDGESVELETVSGEPWAGFNYYLGGRRSRVVINTDVPPRTYSLLHTAAHESYPGHHTEHAWKEALLVDEGGQLEETILLIDTPQSVIAEGIAENALAALGLEAEQACAALLAELGADYDVAHTRAMREAIDSLHRAWTNVAMMIHAEGRSIDEAKEYARRWVLDTEEHQGQRFEFLLHPVWRAYFVLYDAAAEIVRTWVGGDPQRFRRLLTEQMTTADLLSGSLVENLG